MPSPIDEFKLPRGMGRLIRYTDNGPWAWQRWDRHLKKWTCTPTKEINRSRAEQFVFQQVATKDNDRFRYQGITILFSTAADEYLAARRAGHGIKRLRPESLRKLKTAISTFKTFVGAGYDALAIDRVDKVMLKEFLDREAQRLSTDAANTNLNFVSQVLEFAKKQNYLLHVPKVERAVQVEEVDLDDDGIQGWPCPIPEEVRLIISHAKPCLSETGQIANNGSDVGRRVYRGINANDYSDLYTAICMTGMRIGEAIWLTWADVDLANKVILIRPGKKNGRWWQPKTKFGTRRIAIVPELEVIFQRLRQEHKKWVFETRRGTQCHASNVEKRFRQVCEQLGFQKHYVIHSLRKYWASTVAQQGMDWKVMIKMFGHSDFELILKVYYAQNDDARMVAEATKIDFGLGLPKTG